uniref:Uncharacterized protein n=1 Tax=Arundo donax TaxID=35708 RepID=A0A0A9A502_ARUDO
MASSCFNKFQKTTGRLNKLSENHKDICDMSRNYIFSILLYCRPKYQKNSVCFPRSFLTTVAHM